MKIYFASDQHFGAPTLEKSRLREQEFVSWLDRIKEDATALFLLGDLFDFWFEYRKVVPKGFVRVLGKLAEIRDAGIPIYFFTGNHDLWMRDYFEKELQIEVYHQPKAFVFNDKTFLIGHGDALGPGDTGYKLLKKIFVNPIAQWFFRWLHPDLGVALAQRLSLKNKLISGKEDVQFHGEQEMLIQYCKDQLKQQKYDYFVFGHRHLPLEIPIVEKAMYINTGDWITYNSYAVFDGDMLQLKMVKSGMSAES